MNLRWLPRAVVIPGVTMACVLAGVVAAAPADAAISCSVSSLVSAIKTANSTNGSFTLARKCTYTLTKAENATDGGTGLPVITGKVTIHGNLGTIKRSTAAGTPAFRLLDVSSKGSLTLSMSTLSNGLANNGVTGGGAIASHGTLSVSTSTFTKNSAPAATGTSGGAIDSSGTLTVTTSKFTGNTAQEGAGIFSQKSATITDSTFSGNTATIYGGGGLLNAAGTATVTGDTFTGNTGPGGGAIDNDTTLNVSDSTFTGNTAGVNGGGAIVNFGTATIKQSTLAGNSAPFGSDVLNYTGMTMSISMSIVATGQGSGNCGGLAPITDAGYNDDSGSSCGFSSASHSVSNTNPQLDPLAANGGPTQTMALPLASPVVDTIPSATSGCTGTKDQRGTSRPQGKGCDMGAYEVIQTAGTTPGVPTGLTATQVTASSVSLKWTAATGTVTGYTIYRNGKAVGSTGGKAATTFTDLTAAPATAYSYTVDAFDGSSHSAQSSAVKVTTPAPTSIQAVQGGAVSTGSRLATTTITLSSPVHAGDLLTGWFGQFDASGQVQVSDNVNGAWTRGPASTTFGGGGDIALYYLQDSAPAPYGLTITITASSTTFLTGSAGDYSGVATSGVFGQAVAASGSGTSVDSGATGATGAGELVVGGIITGGSPGTVTPGSSQGKPFTMLAQTSAGSADLEHVLSSAAGTQDATATLGTATDWHAMAAVFHPYGAGDTQAPTVPAGLAAGTVTAGSVPLTWNASTDNVGVTGYTIYRDGTKVGTTGGGTTSFTDTTVAPSTSYSYTVDAFDAAGNHSAQSSPAVPVTTPAAPPPTAQWVQGGAVSTGTKVASVTITLSKAVGAGDLLVGWFGQYDASGQVQVSDNVNGTWTRAAGSTTFANGGGDIALYYVENAKSAPAGLTVTISAPAATYLQGSAADYSGVATSGSLNQLLVTRGTGTAADSGATGSVAAGELFFSAIMTGTTPSSATAGGGLVIHDHTSGYSAADASADVAAAGPQDATWQLASSADWYEVAAVFNPAGLAPDSQAPTVPGGLAAGTVTASSVPLTWNASTDNVGVTGYTVYRDGTKVGTTGGGTTSFTDTTVAPSTSYSYTVDAFDAAGNHSAQSSPAVPVTTPAGAPSSPQWVQGGAVATGSKVTTVTITLSKAVGAGDLLAGWFGQYDASGQVQVSDNVNGPWTRATTSTTFSSGGGDIALFYVQNAAAAPAGLTVTITAPAATYLQGSAADYSGVATTGSLDQIAVSSGTGTTADSGATGSASAGELLFSAIMTGASPNGATAGGGLVIHDHTSSYAVADASTDVTTAGPQDATWQLANSADWYEVAAVFHSA
jgi:chitodextrinase